MTRYAVIVLFALFLFAPRGAVALKPGENLLVKFPEGWKLGYQAKRGGVRVSDFIPVNQTIDTWRQMFTVKVFEGVMDSPSTFLDRIEAGIRKGCKDVKADSPGVVVDNGYEAAVTLIACANETHTGNGTLSLMKAISGNEGFYLVRRAWRGKPFPLDTMPVSRQEFSIWLEQINATKVCDTRGTDHPC